MSDVTAVRLAIRDELAADLAIEFVDGKLDGPVERRDLGCSWTEDVNQDAENALYVWATIMIRVFKNYTLSRDPERPFDPAILESLALRIQTSLADKQPIVFGAENLQLPGYGLDVEKQGVEVKILANLPNAFLQV